MPKNAKRSKLEDSSSEEEPVKTSGPSKTKKKPAKDDDSSSDAGVDDPLPAKRKIAEKKEENSWALDRMRFVKINEFRGRAMVDIREYYEKNGETLPGKKGISLSISQWEKLCSSIDEINKALKQ